MCLHEIASYNPAHGAQMSLFDRLGDAPAITAAAELFYRQVLADPLLAPYFDDVDMDRQVAKQAAFPAMALWRARSRRWAWNWRAWAIPPSCAPICAAAPGRSPACAAPLFMAGMSLQSIRADEFVPAVISG